MKNRRFKCQFEQGFSLVESLIVLAFIALILIITIPAISKMLQSYRISTSTAQLQTDLRFARNAAVKKKIFYCIPISKEDASSNKNTYAVQSSCISSTQQLRSLPAFVYIKSTSTLGQVKFDSRGLCIGTSPGGSAMNCSAGNVILYIPGTDLQYRIDISDIGTVQITRM